MTIKDEQPNGVVEAAENEQEMIARIAAETAHIQAFAARHIERAAQERQEVEARTKEMKAETKKRKLALQKRLADNQGVTFDSSAPVAVERQEQNEELVLLERVDKKDPRIPEFIRVLLDPSMGPEERNRLVRTYPEHDAAFGGGTRGVSYYPDYIPLPSWCNWIVAVLLLALGGVILSGEIKTYEQPKDAVSAVFILLLVSIGPGIYCLVWARSSQLRRRSIFTEDEAFPGRWRQGYYFISDKALVDYREKRGVSMYPVENIVIIFSRSSGGSGDRTTEYHLHYRTGLEGEVEGDKETASKGCWDCLKCSKNDIKRKQMCGMRAKEVVYWWEGLVRERRAREERAALSTP